MVAGSESEASSGQSVTSGGILADEMGMGKTIQAISLMLTNRPSRMDAAIVAQWDESDAAHEFKGTSAERAKSEL
eukprot:gene17471-12493_t